MPCTSEVTDKADRAKWHQYCASGELTCVILATISWTDCRVSLALNDEGDKLRRNYKCQIGSNDHFHYCVACFSDSVIPSLQPPLYTFLGKTKLFFELWDWGGAPSIVWYCCLKWNDCIVCYDCCVWSTVQWLLAKKIQGARTETFPRAALLTTNSI